MDCPRCELPLRRQLYEGVEVDFCDACWGCWLDDGELASIIKVRDLHFSEEEKRGVLNLLWASRTGPRQPILCPRCGQFMEQIRYSESVDLLIDRCKKHGIWLDTGELKKLQVEAEKSKEVQSRLIGKLQLQLKEGRGSGTAAPAGAAAKPKAAKKV